MDSKILIVDIYSFPDRHRQTDRRTGRQTERQAGGQIDRQAAEWQID
jgi:hypothetical protein